MGINTYGAAPTYVKIASTTLTSAQATIAFSSIPQTYTDLRLVMQLKNTVGTYLTYIYEPTFSAGIYSGTYMYGNGTSGVSGRFTADNSILPDKPFGSTSTGWSAYTVDFINYSNTTKFKTAISRAAISGSTSTYVYANVGLIRTTSAISSLTVSLGGGNYAIGSTFTLYGIKAALVPKATGGDLIVNDGTYWYHAFRNTGAFFPTQSLTADVLAVAGGGGVTGYAGGGGGAGGVKYTTTQSFTPTSYTVTVGAGGAGGGAGVSGAVTSAQDGSNSNITGGSLSLTAAVGGGGAGGSNTVNGRSGGSGGGGSYSGTGGAGTSGQGNSGGTGGGSAVSGGGGGAGAVGGNGSGSISGNGGAGSNAYSSWLSVTGTGVSGYIAGGGGGGGGQSKTAGSGGAGGGGAGSSGLNTVQIKGTNGTPNTGGGGGGGSDYTSAATAQASGGSGLVIVRYAI